jgi:FixJ family two-component response regulator
MAGLPIRGLSVLLRAQFVVPERTNLSKAVMISIVDDNEPVREATKSLVRSLGYAAATFASAEEYLQSASVRETSCLITDLQMPGMNGIELQNRLLADGYRTPVIFVTAFPIEKLRTRALEAGAFGFLSKPFDVEQLIDCLDQALQQQVAGPAKRPERSAHLCSVTDAA